MEKLDIAYETWLAKEKASLLSLVRDKLLPKEATPEQQEIFEQDIKKVSLAFDIAAFCHEWEMRDNKKDPYITHPIAVARILLEEFPGVNINQVMIALLHDTIEKHKKFKKIIHDRLWLALADHVEALSKRELHVYLEPGEKVLFHAREILHAISRKCYSILQGKKKTTVPMAHEVLKQALKQRRNHAYFSWLDALTDDEFQVKLADRIHALRTIDACDSVKQGRIVNTTHEYFVPVSEYRSPAGHNLLAQEMIRIAQKNVKQRIADAYPKFIQPTN